MIAIQQNKAILAEILRHGLQAVAEQMGAALVRTAYSVNIRSRRDFSCAVFDARGRLIAQAEHIPVHLGLFGGLIERCRARSGDLPVGAMWIVNDPWISGSHLPDVTIVAPVDVDGARIGYVANMAHHVDVGGAAPGSLSLGTHEIAQEGLRMPPLLLLRDGAIDPTIVALVAGASRLPDMVSGDLLAQVAANWTGVQRLTSLYGRIGTGAFEGAVETLLAATAERLRRRLASLEERSATCSEILEWDTDGQERDLVIRVTLAIRDGVIHADFSGTSPQIAGPVNATWLITTSCLLYVAKTYLDPDLPSNQGLADVIALDSDEASLVNAREPAAVALCTSITSQRTCDVLIAAFNQLMPEQAMAASSGSMNALVVGGYDPVRNCNFSYVETHGGGQGALSDADGADATHTHMTNTANSPIEQMEREYPFLVRRYGLVERSGGAGRHRGGHGLVREIELLADCVVTVHMDRTRHRPWGIAGGQAAGRSSLTVTLDGTSRKLPGKTTCFVQRGSVLTFSTAGGGGYGALSDRPAEMQQHDERCGLVARSA
ncbi:MULTISPECIES: hydantoinase B/oxoprolinase family protein [Acetobacteraceae]|uniref:Uncharacterized protein n=2 Tax=Acetobacteraceae TaxID=433 RepID=A0A1U9KLN2_9PROT|nr:MULTISPECIES: hydantoinase B/oxoprolinase family protein [Acetobacteraceae]AQS86679.1 hypothetical protein A0U93_00510 [Neoasaia chiangmaiensis]NHO33802.1 hydantoinase B/oxoprolinase family protein [Acetobacter fallax]NHO37363.1 hydantoinase B/oxoprolinase family protein [Acetobacter fallax]GBR35792.1 5-oxoprolinase [Neoasaia chiangmaiensis NBRC 101099]GEN16651.1 N-methylhydantoinase B [Neoasaia chiangmaiensis]